MKITLVKKILADGNPCPKCLDVERKLTEGKLMHHINSVVLADERNPDSAGMKLAAKHQVTRAPFFIVERAGQTEIYTVYFKFLKQVLGTQTAPADVASEILKDNPDLDFL